jgi:acetyltransferase-like isoleucine patch superfamily enzyme
MEMNAVEKKTQSLRRFAMENGYLLLLQRIAGAIVRRTRDTLLARRLRATGLRIGKDPRLGGLAHLRIGKNFSAGHGLWLEAVTFFAGTQYHPLVTIGDNVNFSDHVHIACTNRVTIGDGVLVGSRVIVTDHDHGVYAGADQSSPHEPPNERRLSMGQSVTIGRNVWLGDGVAILGGAEIGEGSIIGANSVVKGRIPAFCIAVGAPAKPRRCWNAESASWVPWTE